MRRGRAMGLAGLLVLRQGRGQARPVAAQASVLLSNPITGLKSAKGNLGESGGANAPASSAGPERSRGRVEGRLARGAAVRRVSAGSLRVRTVLRQRRGQARPGVAQVRNLLSNPITGLQSAQGRPGEDRGANAPVTSAGP